MISRLRDADHPILILNLLLLMSIGILPFATELMARYLQESQGESLAAAVYSGAFLLMSLLFAGLNAHILLRKAHLVGGDLPLERRRQILLRSILGLIPYAAATALAFISPYITLGICAGVAAYYALPIASGGRKTHRIATTPPRRGDHARDVRCQDRSSSTGAAGRSADGSGRRAGATRPCLSGREHPLAQVVLVEVVVELHRVPLARGVVAHVQALVVADLGLHL